MTNWKLHKKRAYKLSTFVLKNLQNGHPTFYMDGAIFVGMNAHRGGGSAMSLALCWLLRVQEANPHLPRVNMGVVCTHENPKKQIPGDGCGVKSIPERLRQKDLLLARQWTKTDIDAYLKAVIDTPIPEDKGV